MALASDDPAVRRRLGSVGRPLPSLERRDPRTPTATPRRRRRARRDLRARRAGRRRVPRPRRRHSRTAGSRPTTPARSTRTGSSTSRAGSTTSSSAAPRTCHPARSRTSSSPIPRSPTPRWSACPTPSGARRSSPPSCSSRANSHRGRAAGVGPGPPALVEGRRSASCSAHAMPYNETGKLLRRVLRVELTERFGS